MSANTRRVRTARHGRGRTARSRAGVAVGALLLAAAFAVGPRGAHAQAPVPPPGDRSLSGLPADTVEEIVAGAQPGVPATVRFFNRDIVVFRATLLGRRPDERARAAEDLLNGLPFTGTPLRATQQPIGSAVIVGVDGRNVFSIVPADADPLTGETVSDKAAAAVERLQRAFEEVAEAERPEALLRAAAVSTAATIGLAAGLWMLLRAYRRTMASVARTAERSRRSTALADEIVRASSLLPFVQRAISLGLGVVALGLAYFWLTFVLRSFPYTRPAGEALSAFMFDRLSWLVAGVVRSIPDLATVAIIIAVTRIAIRIVQIVFTAVEHGRISVPLVYPETAAPTRKIVTTLLWLFALAISYPYLPGSETDAFKGVSVFIGLMVSLGSSGLVNQIMSGFTVTYSRALRINDFVRIGDVEGTVTQIGTLSTKLETPRHEEVTIPNAVLVSQTVTNFSRNADGPGVSTATSITVGYDVPWRVVQALLLQAAAHTEGVRSTPPPRVNQEALEESAVRYTLLVSLVEPHARASTLGRLHANILDAFNERGIQIMTPSYEGDPDAPKVVPKDRWFPDGDPAIRT